MRYTLLIYSDPQRWSQLSQDEAAEVFGEFRDYTARIAATGEMVGGEQLQGADTATSVRIRGGDTITTDGPYAETKEVLGGYYVVECPDLDRAVELAAAVPSAKRGLDTVEVRPVVEQPAEMSS